MNGQTVMLGATIRLMNIRTEKGLHSHEGPVSPVAPLSSLYYSINNHFITLLILLYHSINTSLYYSIDTLFHHLITLFFIILDTVNALFFITLSSSLLKNFIALFLITLEP